jgi:hypothetical protein
MKIFSSALLIVALMAGAGQSFAQGSNLVYNGVQIHSNTQQTVPAGAVWKVTSIYGEETQQCINANCSNPSHYGFAIISGVYVNNVLIPSTIRGFRVSHARYNDSACAASSFTTDLTCANKSTDPNLLPLWLPAGTTIRSTGPNSFYSVIEFLEQ